MRIALLYTLYRDSVMVAISSAGRFAGR